LFRSGIQRFEGAFMIFNKLRGGIEPKKIPRGHRGDEPPEELGLTGEEQELVKG